MPGQGGLSQRSGVGCGGLAHVFEEPDDTSSAGGEAIAPVVLLGPCEEGIERTERRCDGAAPCPKYSRDYFGTDGLWGELSGVDSLRLTPLPRRDFGNVLSSAVAVGLAKRASAEGVDEKTVAQRLSTVPVFAVTTADGDTPYFTETEYATKASQAVFYIERSDALPALAKVQKSADKDAIISSVPLSSAWALVGARDKKSQEENGGVFKFEASRRQIVHANGNSGRDLGLEKNNLVPLFFDRRVTVTSEGAFPLFFKLEDLEKVYEGNIC